MLKGWSSTPPALVNMALAFTTCTGVGTAVSGTGGSGTPDDVYLFSSFRDNGQDGLHLASSRDGRHWRALNGDRSLLEPRVGKDRLMRDPCIVRGPDGTFHMVWTTGWHDRHIGYASSPDLIRWSEQQTIPVMEHEPTARNAWAPELYYDQAERQFLIFWASTIPGRFPDTEKSGDGGLNHRMYCVTTRDFRTFSPTRLFYDGGFNVIDATLLKASGKYCLIVKDETRYPVKKNLRLAWGERAAGPFGDASPPFTKSWVEGPTAAWIGDEVVVYFDCYQEHRYGAVASRDLKTWRDITGELQFPAGTRHGTVFRVPPAVVKALQAAFPEAGR